MKSKLVIAIILWGWLLFIAWLVYDYLVYQDQMFVHIFKPPYNYQDTAFHILIILVPLVYTLMGYFVLRITKLLKIIKESEENFRALSSIDALTSINNRRGFFNLAEHQLNIAQRLKKKMTLLFIDVDKLKWINDKLGHKEGDLALIATANILKKTFRSSDIIARMGGDEFVFLAIDTSKAGPEVLISRLQESLNRYNVEVDRGYKISISVGFSRYDPETPCSIENLLSQADTHMYEQKKAKKDSSQEIS